MELSLYKQYFFDRFRSRLVPWTETKDNEQTADIHANSHLYRHIRIFQLLNIIPTTFSNISDVIDILFRTCRVFSARKSAACRQDLWVSPFGKICAKPICHDWSLCLRLGCSPLTLFALKTGQRKREGEVTSRNCRRSTTHLNGRSRIAADSVLSPASWNRILFFAGFFTRGPRSGYLTFLPLSSASVNGPRREDFSARETGTKPEESARSA